MSRQKFLFLLTLYFLTVQNVLANEAMPYSGPFIGLNVGYGNSDLTLTATDVPRPSGGWSYPDFGGLNGITFDDQLNGALGGIDVGYNWNNEDWVYGVEASYALLDLNHSDWTKADDKRKPIPVNGIVSGQDDVFTSKLKSLALLSLRLGRKIDKLLFYGRAGFAAGNYHLSVVDQNIPKTGIDTENNKGRGSDKKWLTGYSVGVGGEYLLNESWSAGLEYNYVRLDASNINPGGTGCYNEGSGSDPCSYLGGLERPVTYKMRPEIDLQLMAFHINYHF